MDTHHNFTTTLRAGTLAHASAAAEAAASRMTWTEYLQSKATNTLRAQRADLNGFSTFLESIGVVGAPTAEQLQQGPEAWAHVSPGLLQAFREWMMQQGFATSTVNRRLASVKAYAGMAGIDVIGVKGFGHKAGRNRDEKRAGVGIPTRVGHKKAYKAVQLTFEGAQALRSRTDTPQGRRDALMMALLLDHGLRVGEVAGLTVDCFNLHEGVLTFYRPKVDKVQKHRLTPATQKALAAYAPEMATLAPTDKVLRSSIKGGTLSHEGMTDRAITQRVRDLGKAIGIDNLSAHDCRHYWATRATEAGTHPRRLQQAGGWNSPAMVYRYVAEAEIANEGVLL